MRKIISIVLAAILATSTYCVSAKVMQDTPIRNYNDIKITIDGNTVATNDATEPFIIDGTTYLPVRALAEALGLNVEWDGATNTVKLTRPSNAIPAGTVLYAKNDVKITYNGIEDKEIWGKYIKLTVENYTTEKITFRAEDININGFMCNSSSLYEEVLSGRKANAEIWIQPDLEANGINTLDYIELSFYAIDQNYDRIFETGPMSIILK